jgi:hypothetical protein
MKSGKNSFFNQVLKVGIAVLLAIPQSLWAQSAYEPYLRKNTDSQNPEVSRDLVQNFDKLKSKFTPGLSDAWPENAIPEAYRWALESTEEVAALPADEIQIFFKELLLIMKLAQNGYIENAQKQADQLSLAILRINASVEKLPSNKTTDQRKDEILTEIIRSQMQWSFVALGHLNTAEKKRIEYVLDKIVKSWLDTNTLKNSMRLQNMKNLGLRLARAVNLTIWGGLAILVADIGADIALKNDPAASVAVDHFIKTHWISGEGSPYIISFLASLLVRVYPNWVPRDVSRVKAASSEFLSDLILPSKLTAETFSPIDDQTDPELKNLESEFLKEPKKALNIEELKNLLNAKASTISNIESFFRTSESSPELLEQYETMIQNDLQLSNQANEGSNFRQQYFDKLKNYLGLDIGWGMDPEREILKWTQKDRELHSQPQEILFRRAQMQALQETQVNFGLGEQVSLNELETGRFSNTRLASAYEYYKKRFFQLQSREENSPQATSQTIDDFKSNVIEKIRQVRIQNFQNALQIVAESNPNLDPEIKFMDARKKRTAIKISQLRNASIFFDSSLKEPGSSLDVSIFSKFSKSAHEANRILPVQSLDKMTFYVGVEIFRISENDFNLLLFSLPKFYTDQANQSLGRYLQEASSRDTQLSEAATTLLEKNDVSLDALQRRFRNRVQARFPDDLKFKSLTEIIRYSNHQDGQRLESRLQNIRWAGYLKSTDYWRQRDLIQFKRLSSKKDAHSDPGTIISKNWGLKRALALYALAFVMTPFLGGPYLDAFLANVTLPRPEFNMPDGHHSSAPSNNRPPQDTPVDQKNGTLAEIKDLQMSKPENPYNVPLDQHKKNGEQILFEITPLAIPLEKIPKYMNIMTPQDEAQLGEIRNLFPDKSPLITFPPPSSKQQADFSIQSRILLKADASGIIPIVTPSGYHATSIHLYVGENGDFLPETVDYLPLIVKANGLIYLRLNSSYKNEKNLYSYKVSYEKNTFEPSLSTEVPLLKTKNVNQIAQKLEQQIGATEISHLIPELTSNQNEISISNLERLFSVTGVYTYDQPKPAKFLKNPFSTFAKFEPFLRDGTFYYQCTGSNLLFAQFLNEYYDMHPEIPVRVTNVAGFVRKGNIIKGNAGHLHTLISRTDKNFTYFDLDATPVKMDPKYKDNEEDSVVADVETSRKEKRDQIEKENQKMAAVDQQKKQPKKPESVDRSQPVMRSEPLDLKKLKRFPTPFDPTPENLLKRQEQTQAKMLAENVRSLESQRSAYLELIQKKSLTDKTLKSRANKSTLPGLRILQIVPLILEFAEGKLTAHAVLQYLAALDLGLSLDRLHDARTNAAVEAHLQEVSSTHSSDDEKIKFFIDQFLAEFENIIARESKKAAESKPSEFAYILDQKIQTEIRKAFDLLSTREWSPAHTMVRECRDILK